MPASNFIGARNRSNLVYFYYNLRCKTENRAEVNINSFKFIQLAGFISPIKLFYIINLS